MVFAIYSKKVFLGGLPLDVTEIELKKEFQRYGDFFIDWSSRASESLYNPKRGHFANNGQGKQPPGARTYAFLIFREEASVQRLISKCFPKGDSYYTVIKSKTVPEKIVQVRPWRLTDSDYMSRPNNFLNPRNTVFIGAVPRQTKASDLAYVLEKTFGSVCHASIDVDAELKYPKGAARVTFHTHKSYVAAMTGRFFSIPNNNVMKRLEMKPYVVTDQMCDQCGGMMCQGRPAPYFCGDVGCLQYYCEKCWDQMHYGARMLNKQRKTHMPFVLKGEETKKLDNLPHHPNSFAAFARFI